MIKLILGQCSFSISPKNVRMEKWNFTLWSCMFEKNGQIFYFTAVKFKTCIENIQFENGENYLYTLSILYGIVLYVMLCLIWYHLYNLKMWKTPMEVCCY